MKKIYLDFEMNIENIRCNKDIKNGDIISIGAIKYDTETGVIEEFKSLIKPITNMTIYPHIQELTNITQKQLDDAPEYRFVIKNFKSWLGNISEIEGIYTFGSLDFICFNFTDKKSAKKYDHPRYIANIKSLFVDLKMKYSKQGINCINYISLKNLLKEVNIDFYGVAHDPLYDAYNLFFLDKKIKEDKNSRNLLIIKDFIKEPFTLLNSNLEKSFINYQQNINNEENLHIKEVFIEISKAINLFLLSIKDLSSYGIEKTKDVKKSIECIRRLYQVEDEYFHILDNLILDLEDFSDDLGFYKVNDDELQREIDDIIKLFKEDLISENIGFCLG